MPGRNPYPLLVYQNDNDFKGIQQQVKKPFKPINESSKAQGDEPWNRLYKKATLSSKRNQYHYYDPKSPSDKLDFAIKTIYDQHCDIFQNSNEVVYQQETYTDNHGRILKNRKKETPPEIDPMYPPLKVSTSKKRGSPHKITGVIQGHHTAATNGGYSRKLDGGFYAM